MNILAWIIFGALAGWIASLIVGTDRRQGCLMNVVVGVAGALVGGFLTRLVTGVPVAIGFDLRSMVIAVLGAVLLLLLFARQRRRRR